jgi:predicted RecB family nuclease
MNDTTTTLVDKIRYCYKDANTFPREECEGCQFENECYENKMQVLKMWNGIMD